MRTNKTKIMFNSSNLVIKEKACRRAGESPVLSNFVLLVRSTGRPLLKEKNYANQQNENNQAT